MHCFGRILSLFGVVLLLTGFSSSEIAFKSLSVAGPSDGADIPAALGRPGGTGPFPAVVMIPPCVGLTPTLSVDWARVLAGAGYVTIALENIRPRNMKHCLSKGPRGRPFASWIGDAYGALDYLSRQPYVDINRVALVGFSNGGIILSKYMAEDLATPSGHRFKAMISVYAHCNGDRRPGGAPVGGSPRVPWLVLNGGLERIELKGPCGELKGRPNVTVELIEGAHHAWDVRRFTTPHNDPTGNVMLYSEEATKRSREIVGEFLAKHLKE
jgi:dienelactone hydrolase